jgi:hypothetical protein
MSVFDRAGNALHPVPDAAWRTRTVMYDTVARFAHPPDGQPPPGDPDASARITLIGRLEDALAARHLASESVAYQSSTSDALKQVLFHEPHALSTDDAAMLLARAVQHYDPDGVFYGEAEQPAPQRIATIGLLEAYRDAGMSPIVIDATSELLGLVVLGNQALGCAPPADDLACFVNTVLPRYSDLRIAPLVHVALPAFEWVAHARKSASG